jgi:uncharacterized repeat protein (TIGR01451 family)
MKKLNRKLRILTPTRIGRIVLATLAGLVLGLTVVMAAGSSNFDSSYKQGPRFAETGDLITYTIVAVNTGDSTTGVVLSDALPSEVMLISCSYYTQAFGTAILPCNPSHVWQEDFSPGDRITTTIIVSVTEDSTQYPLVNRAYLSWDGNQKEMVYTTTLNPETYTFLPLVIHQWAWWYKYDIHEPNDKPSQAYGPLVSGQVYQSYIWDATDQDDYYHFTPSTSTDVQVTLSNIPPNCDYDLHIYYYDGQYQLETFSNQSGDIEEQVTFTPVAGRKYYIRIYRYGGFNSQQRYHLTAIYQ